MKLAQALGLSHNVPADSPTVAVISSLETYHFEVFLKAHSIEGSQPLAAKGTGFGSLMLSLIEVIDCPFPCESVVVILDWEDFIPGLSFRSSRNVTTDADDLTPNSLACLFDQLVSLSKYKRLILVPPVMATVPDPGIPPMLVGPLDGLKQDVLKSLIDLEARVAGIELLQMPNVLGTLAPKEWTSEELLFKGGWPYTMGATTLIAATVFDRIRARDASKKILITDLDNTLWRGIAGEDGPGNVSWEPAEATYKHLVYQRLLNRFIERGVLVAVCSKNDPDIAHEALMRPDLILDKNRLVSIRASWQPKSAAIQELLASLNLLPESAVFVDDSATELDEVSVNAPLVSVLKFPENNVDVSSFLERLCAGFDLRALTAEDAKRLQSYRARAEIQKTLEAGNANLDIDKYRKELKMTATIEEVTPSNSERAFQLLNKTNQFNLNAVRETEASWVKHFARGSRVYQVRLTDRLADHGIVLVVVLETSDEHLDVIRLAMSCRVFSRGLEFGLLSWVAESVKEGGHSSIRFLFRETGRNKPLKRFLSSCSEAYLAGADVSRPEDGNFAWHEFTALPDTFHGVFVQEGGILGV